MEKQVKPIFAAIRCKRLRSIAMIVAAEKHARREDQSCERRLAEGKYMFAGRTADNLAWSPAGDPLAVYDAFKQRKKEAGASERKGSALGLHLLAVISPELIKESGDLHDPDNPVNQRIFEQAKVWAEQEFGAGSLIHARMDMDEKGGGVVDLVVVPVHQQTIRGKTKNIISTRKALADISERWGDYRSFSAMQNSFADFARKNIDERIVRGVPKEISDAMHYEPAVLRERDDEVSEREQVAERQEEQIKEKRRSLVKDELALNIQASKLAEEQVSFEKKRLFVAQVWDVLQREVRKLDKKLREKLAEDQQKGRKLASFFRCLIGKDEKKKIGLAIDKGREDGRLERQSDVDAANRKAERAIKDRDRAREDLKKEQEARAKDCVIPAKEVPEYALWKSQQKTKNAPALDRGPERSNFRGYGK
jgi:hypothetical protein